MKDSDSNRSPSDDEKHTDLKPGQLERGGDNVELLPDPDAGLSEAERKAIVRFASCPYCIGLLTEYDYRTANSSGNSTSV